jgi:SulP family sulfate permease
MDGNHRRTGADSASARLRHARRHAAANRSVCGTAAKHRRHTLGPAVLLANGPVALTSILVFGSLSSIATPGSAEWIEMAIWLAIYSGVIQLFLGAFKTGKVAYLVSQPVIIGFVSAAAIIIISTQLPGLLGVELHPGNWLNGSGPLLAVRSSWIITAASGIAALELLLLLRRFFPRFPGVLIVTVAGIFFSWAVDFAAYGGAIVGNLPAGLPDCRTAGLPDCRT